MLVLITELIFTKYHYNEYKIEDQLYLAHGDTEKDVRALCSTRISETNWIYNAFLVRWLEIYSWYTYFPSIW